MAGHAAVGVHDDLAPREPGVGVRPAQLEPTGGVGQDAQRRGVEVGREQRVDDVLAQVGEQQRLDVDTRRVLRGDEHGVDGDGTARLVDDAHLGLAVGPEIGQDADAPDLGQALGEAVRHPDRQRHEVGRLVAGVPEHHPLVTGTLGVELVLASRAGAQLVGGGDALGDVGRLLVERHHHPAGAAVEPVGVAVVADVAHDVSHQAGDVDVALRGDLTCHHHEAGGEQRLARHPAVGIRRRARRRGPSPRSGPPSCRDALRSPTPM